MGKSFIDQNGYRRQTANPISMVGVFPYLGEMIDYDGSLKLEKKKIYYVFRSPEELFSPEALSSFNGIPVIVDHTMLGQGPGNKPEIDKIFKKVDERPADGCIYNVRQSVDTPEYLIADFTIYTDKMKKLIESGDKRDLSLGYQCQYLPCEGIYQGVPYQFKQINLRGNHLALVKRGRCGSSVCVCDSAITFDQLPEEILNMENKTEKEEKMADKLAEFLKKGNEEECQACLDFCNLTPEQRKKALEFLKSQKEEGKTPANDSVGEVPPPPPPPGGEEQPTAGEEPPKGGEEPPKGGEEPPKSGEEPPKGEEGLFPPPPESGEEPPKNNEEPPAAPTGDGSGEVVTTPTAQVPTQMLLSGVEKKDDDGKTTIIKKEAVATEIPVEDGKKAGCCTDSAPKGGKEATKESKKGVGCCGDGSLKTSEESPKEAPKGEEPPNGKEELPKDKGEVEGAPKGGIATTTATDGSLVTPAEQKTDGLCNPGSTKKVESKYGESGIAQDEYEKFAKEYSKAQQLAKAVKPHMGGVAMDSSTMREIDVARMAVKNIKNLAFAIDAADEVVLAAVRGYISAQPAMRPSAAKPTFGIAADSAPVVKDVPKVNGDKALSKYLGEE